ncbi:MAG: hypothetical protein ACNFW9_02445 [Candidatus Kerfeldbacteria bacterium]
MKALKIAFAFVLTLLLASTVFAIDEITVTSAEYDELSIPAWMMGPVEVQFEYDSCSYSIVHILTSPDKEPYLLLIQEEKENKKFFSMVLDLCFKWGGAQFECNITDRGDDICQVIELSGSQHWECDNGEAYVNKLGFVIKEFARMPELSNLSVKIHFKGDLPIWAVYGLSSIVGK